MGFRFKKPFCHKLRAETPQLKTFKDYEPSFVHIDIKYLPQMLSRRSDATCLWPLIVRCTGSICAFMATSLNSAVRIFCVG